MSRITNTLLWPARYLYKGYYYSSRRKKKVIKRTIQVLLAVVVVQLVYPRTVMLPNTSIVGKSYGFKTKSSVKKSIAVNSDQPLTVLVAKQEIKTSTSQIGLKVDAERTVDPALNYSLPSRLIPFTLFIPHHVSDYGVAISNEGKMVSFYKQLGQYNKVPVNAGVKIENLRAQIVLAVPGFRYDGVDNHTSADLRITQDQKMKVEPVGWPASVGDEAAKKTAKAIDERLKLPLEISADNNKQTFEPKDIQPWISTKPDEAKGELAIVYDREKIKQAISALGDKVYVPQTPRTVKYVDGQQVTTIEGVNGREIKIDTSLDAIISAATANQKSVATVVQVVHPTSQTSKGYSRSTQGLQLLISDWSKAHDGSYYVTLKDMAGKIDTSYNGGTQVTSASLYKLYVADIVYTKVAKGEIDLNGYALPGYSVQDCIDVMIHRSDNPCAEALGAKVGWQSNDGFLASQGFGSTVLKSGGFLTTANDTANLLFKLQSGNLIADSYKDTLLSLMKNQIYRTGIPAGSAGTVADKVGFIDDLNHDAAVVYHPNGTYVLVIMSNNSNFSNIADLAKQISNVMKQ